MGNESGRILTYPGYLFSHHVPDTSLFFSKTVREKFWKCLCNLYASKRPDAPAPTQIILTCLSAWMGPSKRRLGWSVIDKEDIVRRKRSWGIMGGWWWVERWREMRAESESQGTRAKIYLRETATVAVFSTYDSFHPGQVSVGISLGFVIRKPVGPFSPACVSPGLQRNCPLRQCGGRRWAVGTGRGR